MLTTLNISNQEIKLVAVRRKKVKCWTSRALESGIVRDGRVLDPQRLGETINQLFKAQKLPRNKVVVSLSGLPYTYRIIRFPLLKESQVKEAIMRAVPDEFTIPVEDLYLSWARLATKLEGDDYFVLGVDRDLADSVVQTMRIAKIKDWSMDIKPLALARAVNATDAIVASLDLDHLDIVLVRGGYIKELHSAVLDRDGHHAEPARYVEQFVSELVKILSYHHDEGDAAGSEKSLAELPILVTGELISPSASEPETLDENQATAMMTKLTGHSVSLIQPPIAGPVNFNANAYATNIGLFFKTRRPGAKIDDAPDHFHDVNIDILSGKYEKKPVMVPMWYTVAPVVVFLLVFGAWSFNSAYSENSDQMKQLQVEISELNAAREARQAKIEQQAKLEKQVAAAAATLESLQVQHESLLAGKGMSTVYIADARSNLPEQAMLKSIRIGSKGVQLSGTAVSPFDIVAYVKSLEAAGYDTSLHEIGNDKEGGYTFQITLQVGPAEET